MARPIDVGLTEVAFLLRHFVFEHELVPKHIPGDSSNHAMVLMAVVATMRENDVGGDLTGDLFEAVLDAVSELCTSTRAGMRRRGRQAQRRS